MESILKEKGFESRIVDLFTTNDIDIAVFKTMTAADLTELGITSFGLRRKLQLLQNNSSLPQKSDSASMTNSGTVHHATPPLAGEPVLVDEDPPLVPDDHDLEAEMELFDNCAREDELEEQLLAEPEADNPPDAMVLCFAASVPDRLDGWENDFAPIQQYSASTNMCISQGSLNSAARTEITQATASQIMNICRYPTTKQLQTVASKIMHQIKIKDAVGIGYESWVGSIDRRLRNMRRRPRSASLGLSGAAPPKKRPRKQNHPSSSSSETYLDQVSYDRHIDMIRREWQKTIKRKSAINDLMVNSFSNRRKWITTERPRVKDVIERFPPLSEYSYLMIEFATTILS